MMRKYGKGKESGCNGCIGVFSKKSWNIIEENVLKILHFIFQ